jgi:hypothetical protein
LDNVTVEGYSRFWGALRADARNAPQNRTAFFLM